jgi:hypothetical protein
MTTSPYTLFSDGYHAMTFGPVPSSKHRANCRPRVAWMLTLFLLALPPAVTAQYYYETNSDHSITIGGYTGSAGVLAIPGTINGLPVTSIHADAFYGANVFDVTIPDSVLSIGIGAFENCSNLASVVIGHGVTSIGQEAFAFCPKLMAATIPESVTNLDEWAFRECPGITNFTVSGLNPAYSSLDGVLFDKAQTRLVTYPQGEVGDYVIPPSVTTIGENAFDGCTGLTSVVIGPNVTNIDFAFHNCAALTNITASESNAAFSSVEGVLFNKARDTLVLFPQGKRGDYQVPNSVLTIRSFAFQGCTGLLSVEIGNSVTYFDGNGVFAGCTGLLSVKIGNSVTDLGNMAFLFVGCTNLTNITVDPLNSVYASADGVLIDKSRETLLKYPPAKAGAYSVPDGILSIESQALSDCTALTTLRIADSVTTIKSDSEFSGCTALTSVLIGSGVIGGLDRGWGYFPFDGCPSLTNITVAARNPVYSSVDGVLFNKNLDTLIAYPSAKQGDYDVPGFVRQIGYEAFSGCAGLTGITIPDSVTNLSARALLGTGVRTVTIGSGVSYLFYGLNGNIFWNTELTDYIVSPLNPIYSSRGGILFNKSGDTLVDYPEGRPGPTILLRNVPITGFGFDVAGRYDVSIVVEAATNPISGPWVAIQTNMLANGLTPFADLQWTNYTARFYRIRLL